MQNEMEKKEKLLKKGFRYVYEALNPYNTVYGFT